MPCLRYKDEPPDPQNFILLIISLEFQKSQSLNNVVKMVGKRDDNTEEKELIKEVV